MIINFSPQENSNKTLTLEKISGNILVVNGTAFDFNALKDGDTIPEGVVPCEDILGTVKHIDGHVMVTILLPYTTANAGSHVTFPQPITAVEDGPIEVPFSTYSTVVETETDLITTTYTWKSEPKVVVEPKDKENANVVA